MKAQEKSKGQLINELEELHQKVAELEALEVRSAKRAEPFADAKGEWERTFDVIPRGTMLSWERDDNSQEQKSSGL